MESEFRSKTLHFKALSETLTPEHFPKSPTELCRPPVRNQKAVFIAADIYSE